MPREIRSRPRAGRKGGFHDARRAAFKTCPEAEKRENTVWEKTNSTASRKIQLKHFRPDFTGRTRQQKTKPLTSALCQRVGQFKDLLYANARPCLIIFQGMDSGSGKDGAGKRVLEFVNPAGVETTNFKVPSAEERAPTAFLAGAQGHSPLRTLHFQLLPLRGGSIARVGTGSGKHLEESLRPDQFVRGNADGKRDRDPQVFLHINQQGGAGRRAEGPPLIVNWKFQKEDLTCASGRFGQKADDAINQLHTWTCART